MDWKKFLKPDLKKIALAAVLYFVMPFPVYQAVMCKTGGVCPPAGWVLYPLFGFLVLQAGLAAIFDFPEILLIIAALAIAYLASCAVFHIIAGRK